MQILLSRRMRNLIECSATGTTNWQKRRHYGRRNVSKTTMQRFKKIIGNKLHSRKPKNQSQEMLLGCSILNRFTLLGMPNSYRVPDHIQRQESLSVATKPTEPEINESCTYESFIRRQLLWFRPILYSFHCSL